MEESQPREMAFQLPVVCARAVLVDKQEKNGVYRCPVYKTQLDHEQNKPGQKSHGFET